MEPSLKIITTLLLALMSFSYEAWAIRPITQTTSSYVVIFDAGSTGSRVHVYQFDSNLDLVPMGDDLELYESVKPGLSSYASDPKAAAMSLKPLLEDALKVIPKNVRAKTPLRLGATAGLRQLPGDQADRILEEVAALLGMSGLLLPSNSIIVLDGKDEGTFLWISINYLSGTIGKPFDKTIGAVDLGGGSVQMVYAIPKERAGEAPEGDVYLKTLYVGGRTYYLYVHSYLNYGLLAARAQVLKLTNGSTNPCIATGFKGQYVYGGVTYTALSPKSGANFTTCRGLIFKALNLSKACSYDGCTFDGIWSGGGGAGAKELYLASYFYDRARELGIFKDPSSSQEYVRPSDFKRTARKVCSMSAEAVKEIHEEDYGYMCLDLVYEYTLLVEGFGIPNDRKVMAVSRIPYKGFQVDTSWSLGCAIEAISSLAAAS